MISQQNTLLARRFLGITDTLDIGVNEGSEYEMFGDIRDIEIDPDGRLFIWIPGLGLCGFSTPTGPMLDPLAVLESAQVNLNMLSQYRFLTPALLPLSRAGTIEYKYLHVMAGAHTDTGMVSQSKELEEEPVVP